MKKKWTIMPLQIAEITMDKSHFTLGVNMGQIIKSPCMVFAVFNDDMKILVDTGVSEVEWIRENISAFSQRKEQRLENALEGFLGWHIDDIDFVINTHLHYDHCGNNKLFYKKNIFIQRREWQAANNPAEHVRNIYPKRFFGPEAVNYFNWEFINGEKEILPGLILFPTPGHSAGHQSVLVDAQQGVTCITGDICNIEESLYENYTSTVTTNYEDIFESLRQIRYRAKYFIPSHDSRIKSGQTKGFPLVESKL